MLGGKKFACSNKCFVQMVAGGKWWCMVSGSGW